MSNEFVLHREQHLRAPLQEVFPFFANPENLELLTPKFLHFEILTPRPIEMRVGQRIEYRIRLRGLPMKWISEITAFEPLHRFVDEQIKGPYSLWHHEHRFIADGDGTRVIDHVRYKVLGGKLIAKLLVEPDLERIFDYRANVLAKRFGTVHDHANSAVGV